MPKSTTLSLAMRVKGGKDGSGTPMSPKSPGSSSQFAGPEYSSQGAQYTNMESPASPKLRKDSKSIFSNFSAAKSSARVPQEALRRQASDTHTSSIYSNGRTGSSTPDLSRPIQTPNSDDNHSEIFHMDHRSGTASSTEPSDPNDSSKRDTLKARKPVPVGRSRSIKRDENAGPRSRLNKAPPQLSPDIAATWTASGDSMPLKTAPLEKGQSWRQNIGLGKLRTHSADRHDGSQHAHRDDDRGHRRDRAEQGSLASSSYNEGRGTTLMSSLGSGARKVGEKMDSARKGVFGKLARSSSHHDPPPPVLNEPYVCKIIHKPLIEQTRLTRISSRLELSRDKTEFWMPALAWRCVDYLNMRGCEEEGLYRVPGSAQQVRYYERKFDEDRDIDLISDDNLNDPNVIGSLFKNWLRQLPDEIFPKAIQARIQQECQGAKTTPQMLKDELSKLPPFNYYLLFAITCHISLLHASAEFNKMNYNNLCICFQPAIKIDAFCFQFLVLDWKSCWQGCWTEKEYLAQELAFLQAAEPPAPQVQQTPSRNPPPPVTIKPQTIEVPHANQPYRPAPIRSQSADQSKSSSRTHSKDRNGRATPPNLNFRPVEATNGSAHHAKDIYGDDRFTERTLSSSESNEPFNVRGTPARAPASVSTEGSADSTNETTPVQAAHSRGPSDSTQFRLDLNNPPGSPFTVKF